MSSDSQRIEREARRTIVGKRAREELVAFLDARLPHLAEVTDVAAWRRRAQGTRKALLDLFFRGHPSGLLRARFPVEWLGTAYSGQGFRVRKVRYEGYPGLWIPALLYEPAVARKAGAKVPVVLNPNGHHAGGKAMAYKQARCINLAKRGVLALSSEFLGMGELSGSRHHNYGGHLDLVGIAGVGVFYLIMKRALDVLLSHPAADPRRVAMTGLSGGGWQTIVLSALDERITASVPVAGHTAVWQRIHHPADRGDLEQVPPDLCTVADYDVLSGMLAPRPTLFVYNRHDDCCFPTARALVSVVEPARRVFELFGAGDRVSVHDNEDPGTHNYEADNRSQLYTFLNKHFGLAGPESDLPWEEELLTEEQCTVGLPPGNATLLGLAAHRARELGGRSGRTRRLEAAVERRQKRAALEQVLHLSRSAVGSVRRVSARRLRGVSLTHAVARIDEPGHGWSLPLVHARPLAVRESRQAEEGKPASAVPVEGSAAFRFRGGEVVLAVSDGGRADALSSIMDRCCGGSAARGAAEPPKPAHLVAADVYGTGELTWTWQEHMLVAGAGARPLGLQVSQILALSEWVRAAHGASGLCLHAFGLGMSVAALLAVSLEPALYAELVTDVLPDTLRRLIDWPVSYEAAAPLFCFGLLERIDVPELLHLCEGVLVRDTGRGPLVGAARRAGSEPQ